MKLPSSDYTTVFNLAMSFAAGLYGGDEACSADEDRVTLLKYSIYTAFKVIDDFDLFAKIRAINPSFAVIDLTDSLSELFRYGSLEVCNNNLMIGLLSSLEIKALKKYVNINPDTNACKTLSTLVGLIPLLGLEDMLFGLQIEEYIDVVEAANTGTILLGDLIDDNIASFLTLGLTNDSLATGSTYSYKGGVTDSAVPDNNVSVTMTTMAYVALN